MTISWDFNHRYSLVYKGVDNVGIFFGSHVMDGTRTTTQTERDLGGENKYKCQLYIYYTYTYVFTIFNFNRLAC